MTNRQVNRRIFLSRTATAAAATAALTALPSVLGQTASAEGAAAAPALSTGRRPTLPDINVRPVARQDPTEATLAEAIVLLRTGRLTSTALVDAHLDRIDKFESVYQAFNAVTASPADAENWLDPNGQPMDPPITVGPSATPSASASASPSP